MQFMKGLFRAGLILFAVVSLIGALLAPFTGMPLLAVPALIATVVFAGLERWLKNTSRPVFVMAVVVVLMLLVCVLGYLTTAVQW